MFKKKKKQSFDNWISWNKSLKVETVELDI